MTENYFNFNDHEPLNEIDSCILDAPITENEISSCLSLLKNGKSAGIDGVISEFLKSSEHIIMPFLNFFF